MPALPKNTSLLLLCCFRQAERSVHYALSSPNQWQQFIDYYDTTRSHKIEVAIELLKEAGAVDGNLSRQEVRIHCGLFAVAHFIIGYFFNPFKRSWRFSVQHIAFFYATLKTLQKAFDNSERSTREELIQLRSDCFVCYYLIRNKMFGLVELRKADAIEHYNQSDYISHATFDDVGIRIS